MIFLLYICLHHVLSFALPSNRGSRKNPCQIAGRLSVLSSVRDGEGKDEVPIGSSFPSLSRLTTARIGVADAVRKLRLGCAKGSDGRWGF